MTWQILVGNSPCACRVFYWRPPFLSPRTTFWLFSGCPRKQSPNYAKTEFRPGVGRPTASVYLVTSGLGSRCCYLLVYCAFYLLTISLWCFSMHAVDRALFEVISMCYDRLYA